MGKTISFTINFDERELIVDELIREAGLCSITVEQLIKRCILDAMEKDDDRKCTLGETLEDFLVKNGAISPKKVD